MGSGPWQPHAPMGHNLATCCVIDCTAPNTLAFSACHSLTRPGKLCLAAFAPPFAIEPVVYGGTSPERFNRQCQNLVLPFFVEPFVVVLA